MHCLWCDETIRAELNWSSFFQMTHRNRLCNRCELGLNVLNGKRCKKCSRESEADICPDCIKWTEVDWSQWSPSLIRDPLECNYSVFAYNDFMKEIIAKWKYRGDYILALAFQKQFTQCFEQFRSTLPADSVIVPIPLSQERLTERGFNQSLVLAKWLPPPVRDILSRQHGEKQAKKSRYERIQTNNPFILDEIINKTVILVDDIYTTGTTLRHAASLLRQSGCPAVYAYTLIRG